LDKVELTKPAVKFVGYSVGLGKKISDQDKIQVTELQRPMTLKQLRSVSELLVYHSSYIPGYAENVKPLTDLTSGCGSSVLQWTECQQLALDLLQEQ
jgi:hypothetical protein